MMISQRVISTGIAAVLLFASIEGASARSAHRLYAEGHGYGRHHYYGHRRGPDIGPAVAGAALGIVGLAAGAAAANAYNDDDDDYGYGRRYRYGYAPSYGYAPTWGYSPSYGYPAYIPQ